MRVTLSVASSGGDPTTEIARLVALSRTLPGELAQVAADVGERVILSEAAAIRGSLSMSNNKQGARLDALPIVRGGGLRAEAEIQAVPRGAWTLANDGAKAHVIRPKKRRAVAKGAPRPKRGKKGKGNRQRALSTPYGVFAVVHHPGTSGDRSWDRAMAAAEPTIDRAVQTAFTFAVEGQ